MQTTKRNETKRNETKQSSIFLWRCQALFCNNNHISTCHSGLTNSDTTPAKLEKSKHAAIHALFCGIAFVSGFECCSSLLSFSYINDARLYADNDDVCVFIIDDREIPCGEVKSPHPYRDFPLPQALNPRPNDNTAQKNDSNNKRKTAR